MNRTTRLLLALVALLALSAILTACGPGGPDTDLDINARVLEIKPDENWIKLNEQNSGRKYEMKLASGAEIVQGNDTLAFTDIQVGNQVRVWANKTSGDVKYEILKILVVDSGEAAPSMR